LTDKSYLLDTNAAVALLNNDESMVKFLDTNVNSFLSIITIGELYFGAEKSGRAEANRTKVTALAERYRVLSLDAATAYVYGRIYQQLRKKGRPIPMNDVWIAAIALQHNLTLLTRDEHFEEVDNLPLATW
jgi:tRNA(fMet)-specific endonuclease VapC